MSSVSVQLGTKGGKTLSPSLHVGEDAERAAKRFDEKRALETMQKWLFMEGGHMMGVLEMVDAFAGQLHGLTGVSIDRMLMSCTMCHPEMSAYMWKWAKHTPVEEFEVDPSCFGSDEKFSPAEPFRRLHEKGEKFVRIRNSDTNIAECLNWFVKGGYTDYLALPMYYRGELSGAVSWTTSDPAGFLDAHIRFFHEVLGALSTVMRLHANEMAMKTMTGRLEEKVKERTAELAKANQELEAANTRIKKQSAQQLKHFAMMSHEIRTPLNCIVAMSSLLEDSMKDRSSDCKSSLETLQMITQSGALLATVVNDVLDYARLDSGELDIKIESVNLKETLQLVIRGMTARGKQNSIEINTSAVVFELLPQTILIDGCRLQQILYNLLGNAIKFSEKGRAVDFEAFVLPSRDHIRFIVRDYGRGIPDEDLTKIFEPFEQGQKGTQQASGGTGLGLAITKKLVLGLGGTINARSCVGAFSEFSVDMPMKQLHTQYTQPNSAQQLQHSTSFRELTSLARLSSDPTETSVSGKIETLNPGIRVLVVDDNTVNQKILERILRRLQIEHVHIASNGREAVEMEITNHFDVILMDIQMPIMDGLTAADLIVCRQRSSGDHKPHMVFVTAHALEAFRKKALQVAEDVHYLSKPYNLEQIRDLLEHLGIETPKTPSS